MRIACLLLAALLSLAPSKSQATAQEADVLMLDGKAEPIFTNPLEGFLERHKELRFKPSSTANWRGYVATFAIRDESLWLEKVEVSRYVMKGTDFERRSEDRLSTLFPGKKAILVDWYTGVLVIPRGKRLRYVHMGYGSTYERYVLLEIRKGRLVGRHEMTAAQFDAHRRTMFAGYKKTPAFAKQRDDAIKSGLDAESAEQFIFDVESANYLTRSIAP